MSSKLVKSKDLASAKLKRATLFFEDRPDGTVKLSGVYFGGKGGGGFDPTSHAHLFMRQLMNDGQKYGKPMDEVQIEGCVSPETLAALQLQEIPQTVEEIAEQAMAESIAEAQAREATQADDVPIPIGHVEDGHVEDEVLHCSEPLVTLNGDASRLWVPGQTEPEGAPHDPAFLEDPAAAGPTLGQDVPTDDPDHAVPRDGGR